MAQTTTKYSFLLNDGKDYGFELTYNPDDLTDFEDFMENSLSFCKRDEFTPQRYCDLVMQNYPHFVCKELVDSNN